MSGNAEVKGNSKLQEKKCLSSWEDMYQDIYKITCSPQVQNTYDTTHLKKQYGEIQIDHPNIIIKHEIKKIYFKKFFNFKN